MDCLLPARVCSTGPVLNVAGHLPPPYLDNHCKEQEYSCFAGGEHFSAVFTKQHMQDSIRDACCCGIEHFIIMMHIPVYLFQEKSDILS